MFEVIQSSTFSTWFGRLRDRNAVDRIAARIERLALGNAGDCKSFKGISEMRIDYGPGYRVYFVKRGNYVLLCGGNKRTQAADITRAIDIAKQFKG